MNPLIVPREEVDQTQVVMALEYTRHHVGSLQATLDTVSFGDTVELRLSVRGPGKKTRVESIDAHELIELWIEAMKKEKAI